LRGSHWLSFFNLALWACSICVCIGKSVATVTSLTMFNSLNLSLPWSSSVSSGIVSPGPVFLPENVRPRVEAHGVPDLWRTYTWKHMGRAMATVDVEVAEPHRCRFTSGVDYGSQSSGWHGHCRRGLMDFGEAGLHKTMMFFNFRYKHPADWHHVALSFVERQPASGRYDCLDFPISIVQVWPPMYFALL
jgi:hypothetical protein